MAEWPGASSLSPPSPRKQDPYAAAAVMTEGVRDLRAEDAGLVEEHSEGVRRIYSLRREGLLELRDWLDSFWDDALAAFKQEVEKP